MITKFGWVLASLGLIGLAFAANTKQSLADVVQVDWEAARYFVEGEDFHVTLRLQVTGDKPVELEPWALSAAAFSVDGRALGSRKGKQSLALEAGQVVETTLSLSSAVFALEAWDRRPFRLTYHGVGTSEAQEILFFEIAEKGIEFFELPAKQLEDYQVIFRTNQGDMWIEVWPKLAEQHVRNFLDLTYTGFYEGSAFHRVIPGMMIQGGRSKSGKKAPRTLKAEFSDKKHLRGILSMARVGHDINSASSEFFVMHARYPSLDGKYSAFGTLLEGEEALDRIVMSGDLDLFKRNPSNTAAHVPKTPQLIERAMVVKKVTPPKKKD